MNDLDPSIIVRKNTIIEDGSYIGKNVKIGDFCIIRSGANIGGNCSLSSYCEIRANVKIDKNTKLGRSNKTKIREILKKYPTLGL